MSAERLIKARWLWPGQGPVLENQAVRLRGGRVLAVVPAGAQGAEDLGDGLLLPGLVNAHTHLELSGLAGLIPPRGDFVEWVTRMVAVRPNQDPDQAAAATLAAARSMAEVGVALVGDITNTGLARRAMHQAGLHGVSLFEALGRANCPPPAPEALWRGGLLEAQGVAAHAPYSVPGPRMAQLKALAGHSVFCLHLAESVAEMEFIAGEGPRGEELAEFLAVRGVRREDLGMSARRPLEHLLNLGVVDRQTLLVHCVQLNEAEIGQVARAGASVCICPRSNLGLTGRLARVEAMAATGLNLCLGTDSLASAPDLNPWREMATLADQAPSLDPMTILAMATRGGAKALGMERYFGFIGPDAVAPLCLVPLEPLSKPDAVARAAVHQAHAASPKPVARPAA